MRMPRRCKLSQMPRDDAAAAVQSSWIRHQLPCGGAGGIASAAGYTEAMPLGCHGAGRRRSLAGTNAASQNGISRVAALRIVRLCSSSVMLGRASGEGISGEPNYWSRCRASRRILSDRWLGHKAGPRRRTRHPNCPSGDLMSVTVLLPALKPFAPPWTRASSPSNSLQLRSPDVAAMAPSINDVSTDLESPPKFRLADIGDLPAEYKPVIREHYADLAPLIYEGSALPLLAHPRMHVPAAIAVADRPSTYCL